MIALLLLKTLGLLSLARIAYADDDFFNYLNTPELKWQNATSDGLRVGPEEGNGLYMSPDGNMLVSTSVDATVRAFDPKEGTILWSYKPDDIGFPVRCFGGVTFSENSNPPYLVFSVADAATDKENSPIATTRVIALDMMGNELFQSSTLPGITAGKPVTDRDGQHIILTHNVNQETGYISVLLTTLAEPGTALEPIFTSTYEGVDPDTNETVVRPFSPVGYYHAPAEGFYDGGEGNTNDVFIFAWDTPRDAITIANGDGQMFVMQFPLGYIGNGQGIGFEPMGDATDFHATTPPMLTNNGRSMYWSVTKSQQDAYVGIEGLDRTRFSRGRTARRDENLPRGEPKWRSARAAPTLSSDPAEPTVYGVGASNQLWRLDFEYALDTMEVVETEDLVSSRVLLTLDENFVIYATKAELVPGGGIFVVESLRLRPVLNIPILGGIEGDIALSADGTTVYAANPAGELFAYAIAEDLSPTSAPTVAPTWSGSQAPTTVPTTSAPTTAMPTGTPTTAAPTEATKAPTATPTTAAPSASPSAAPSMAPSTPVPTATPTTAEPTSSMMPSSTTESPTPAPSTMPSVPPTGEPTATLTAMPTRMPVAGEVVTTDVPTTTPTDSPEGTPVANPTGAPSEEEISGAKGAAFWPVYILGLVAAFFL